MEKEFCEGLYEIGRACGKIAKDIVELHKNLEEVLFVVPLRGGLPIWVGVGYGLYKCLGPFEADVLFIPASSTVEKRSERLEEKISSLLKKRLENYKAIVIVDEAISGSSSKMVLDSVKEGVKNYTPDNGRWRRSYWERISIELYLVAAHLGKKLNPRIQKLRNVLIYPVTGNIVTTDNSKIYPVEYINEIRREKSEDGIVHKIVSPDVLFLENKYWREVVNWIERGVDKYFEEEISSNQYKVEQSACSPITC
ncbi:MAG: hypothetical protein QW040_03925 [Candidatus Aenigmatarchaeota archaeon]